MSDESLFPIFSTDAAIVFMRSALPLEVNKRYSDDDLDNVIDAIWDYYDMSGVTSLDNIDDDIDDDTAVMSAKLLMPLKELGIKHLTDSDLQLIINAEKRYEENLDNIF